MTALFNRRKKDQGATEKPGWLPPLRSRATLIGSFMPDTPLILIGIVFFVWDRMEGNVFDPGNADSFTRMGDLFDNMFFNDWRVKSAHNLFHAPLMTMLYTAIGYVGWKRDKKWGAWLFWFGVACMAHSTIDIAVHHNDGPLLLFPFDFNTRFYSPVSYWDPAYYGTQFAIFEHLLFLGMVGYLFWSWRQRRGVRQSAETTTQST